MPCKRLTVSNAVLKDFFFAFGPYLMATETHNTEFNLVHFK